MAVANQRISSRGEIRQRIIDWLHANNNKIIKYEKTLYYTDNPKEYNGYELNIQYEVIKEYADLGFVILFEGREDVVKYLKTHKSEVISDYLKTYNYIDSLQSFYIKIRSTRIKDILKV